MGIFDGVQKWQRRRKAKALLDAGDVQAARVVIADDAELRHELAEGLMTAERLDLSRALLGHEGGSTLQALLDQTPADPELDRLLAEAEARTPPGEARVLQLSKLLLERGQTEPALSLLERAALSARTWPLLRAGLEGSIDAKSWDRAWHLVEAAFGQSKKLRGTSDHAFLLRAHELVLTQREGAQAVLVDLMMRGEVDPFSGRNFLELAAALMRESPALTSRFTLVSAPDELLEGEERLRSDRKNASALALVGSAKLRLGELEEAAEVFARGRDVAPRHFALVLGLGAARALSREGAIARVRSLPDLAPLEGLGALLPDLEQLTMLELRVAQASVRPLAHWLSALQGQHLRVLPLDVRATDVPQLDARQGTVRVEALLDLGEHGWALAREVARRVHQVLPEALKERIDSAAFTEAYPRWLCRKYGFPVTLEDSAAQCVEAATALQ